MPKDYGGQLWDNLAKTALTGAVGFGALGIALLSNFADLASYEGTRAPLARTIHFSLATTIAGLGMNASGGFVNILFSRQPSQPIKVGLMVMMFAGLMAMALYSALQTVFAGVEFISLLGGSG